MLGLMKSGEFGDGQKEVCIRESAGRNLARPTSHLVSSRCASIFRDKDAPFFHVREGTSHMTVL
jgi:hypothetical protein